MNETVEFPLPISQQIQIQIQIQIQLLRMVMVGAHGWCAWLVLHLLHLRSPLSD
jgi:hypothetical protein